MDPSIISSALILAAVLIAVGAVSYGVYRARKTAREIARQAFGTNTLREGFAKAEADFENTPRSLAAQTSLALPRIKADFPEFNYDEMRTRAKNVVLSYLQSIDEKNASLLSEGNAELKKALELHINNLANNDQDEQYGRLSIHRTEISRYIKRDGRCIITFQMSVQSKHLLTKSDGTVVKGKPDHWEQSRWETDLVYIQDMHKMDSPDIAALGLNCPNCGAPITNLGHKHCEYCGTGIREINLNAWTFNAVRES